MIRVRDSVRVRGAPLLLRVSDAPRVAVRDPGRVRLGLIRQHVV